MEAPIEAQGRTSRAVPSLCIYIKWNHIALQLFASDWLLTLAYWFLHLDGYYCVLVLVLWVAD
jgi:hypothetical protein